MNQRIAQIVRERDVLDYFRQMVGAALRGQRVATEEVTEAYLVQLLAAYSSTERLVEEGFFDRPLAIQWHEALAAAGGERLMRFRALGDTALYVSGFFSDSIGRRGVGIDYYIAFGGHAYRHAATTLRARTGNEAFARIFHELADKFVRFVDVFGEVSESAERTTNQGVLRLYERWLRTRSDWIRRKLSSRGVLVRDEPGVS